MTRFARLMAATMAALFTGALAAPAYATGGGGRRLRQPLRGPHLRLQRLQGRGHEVQRPRQGRQARRRRARPPRLPHLGRLRQRRRARRRRALRRHRRERQVRDHGHQPAVVVRRDPHVRHHSKKYRLREKLDERHRHRRLDLLLPERLDLRRLRHGQRQRLPLRPRPDRREEHAQGHGQGLRQLPQGEAEDHGHQGPGPEQRLRPLRPQGRRRHRQGGRRRRRHGLDARRAGSPPGHRDRRAPARRSPTTRPRSPA